MNQARPAKTSIWRESFSASRRTANIWAPWALGFAVLSAFLYFFEFRDHLSAILEQFQKLHDGARSSTIPPMPPRSLGSSLSQLANSLLQLTAFYSYIVLYLRQEPITLRPDFSINGFFYWLGKLLLKILAVLAVVLVSGVLVGVGMFLAGLIPIMKAPIMIVAILFAVGVTFYVIFKYALVGPLAVSRMKPVLKSSWNLMRGNCWRYFWQSLAFTSIIWLVFMVVIICVIVLSLIMHIGVSSAAMPLIFSLLMGTFVGIFYPLLSVFLCTATRAFYEERLRSDPNFTLTSSS